MAGTERTEKKREKSKVKKVTQKDESSFSFYLHAALFLFFLTTYAFLLFLSKHKYPLILNNEILPEVLFFCLALLILSFVGLFLVSFWPLLMTLVISFITGMTVSYVLGLFLPYNSGHFLLHYLPFLPHDIQLYLASNGDMFAGIITGLLLFGLLRLSKGSILVLFSIPLLSALFMLLNTESKRTIPEKIQSVDALTPRENEKNENLIYLILADHSGYAVSAESWQRLNSKNPNANELPFSPTFIPSFYQENNFNLYPNIYLRYQFRHRNIGNILNPFLTGVKDDLFDRRGTSHYLSSNDPAVSATRNDLFKELKSKGYHINVYQSFPFNFCQNREMNEIANCTTYPAPIGALYQTNLSTASRMMLIAGHWLSSTPLGKKATEYFYKKANEKTDASKLPLLGNPFSRSMPIGQSSVLANLRQDVLNAKGKNLFFAHVNLPHYPYVYDKNCQLRTDPMEWRTNAPYTDKKEPNGEQKRWENYNQQLFCTYAQINHLIKELEKAQLMDKTTIIIHGDKGADIRREKADEVGIARQDKSVDLFKNSMTTVFAIRTPQEKAKINNESCDIVTLVERFVLNNNTAVCQPLASPSLTKEEQDKATEWLKLPIADNYLKTGPYTPLYTEWLENGGQAYMAYLDEQLKQESGKKSGSKISFVAPPSLLSDAEEKTPAVKEKSANFVPVPEKEDLFGIPLPETEGTSDNGVPPPPSEQEVPPPPSSTLTLIEESALPELPAEADTTLAELPSFDEDETAAKSPANKKQTKKDKKKNDSAAKETSSPVKEKQKKAETDKKAKKEKKKETKQETVPEETPKPAEDDIDKIPEPIVLPEISPETPDRWKTLGTDKKETTASEPEPVPAPETESEPLPLPEIQTEPLPEQTEAKQDEITPKASPAPQVEIIELPSASQTVADDTAAKQPEAGQETQKTPETLPVAAEPEQTPAQAASEKQTETAVTEEKPVQEAQATEEMKTPEETKPAEEAKPTEEVKEKISSKPQKETVSAKTKPADEKKKEEKIVSPRKAPEKPPVKQNNAEEQRKRLEEIKALIQKEKEEQAEIEAQIKAAGEELAQAKKAKQEALRKAQEQAEQMTRTPPPPPENADELDIITETEIERVNDDGETETFIFLERRPNPNRERKKPVKEKNLPQESIHKPMPASSVSQPERTTEPAKDASVPMIAAELPPDGTPPAAPASLPQTEETEKTEQTVRETPATEETQTQTPLAEEKSVDLQQENTSPAPLPTVTERVLED